MRTRLFFGLAFLLASVLTSAQTLRDQIGRFDVAGYPGNSFPVVLTFPAGAPVSLSAVSKYIGTNTPLPTDRQPSVAVSGNTATITFKFPRSAFEWQGYYEISWSGRTQLSGDLNAKLSNRNSNAPVTTLLVASADKTNLSVSLIGGAGGSAGVTAADIAAVGDARYRKSSDPITWSMIPDRPVIPTFPTWLPNNNPGYQNETQVNGLISTSLQGIQGTLTQQATDILNRVPFSTYSTNRSTDQNATAAAQLTANNALSTAQSAGAGVLDVKLGYVPKSRTITINGITYGLDQNINATVTAGQAGVTSLNGKNGNLTGFVESSDLAPYGTRLTAVENGKVNAVAGMGLSSNDFTSGLLAKLNSLQNYSLPIATGTALGGVKLGSDFSSLGDGTFTVNAAAEKVRVWAYGASGNGIDYGGNGTYHLRNSSVAALVASTLRGYDGFDETVANQVLSHVGQTYKWIVATTGTGSTTTTAPSTASYRDSVMINADSTKMRFARNSSTRDITLNSIAEVRSFLSTTQSNVSATLAELTYSDGNVYEQTGNWDNVELKASARGKAIFENNGFSLVWINQGGATRRRVKLKDFVLRTSYTQASDLAIFHHNELPDYDGLELDGLEIYHTNPTQAKANGFTFALYSETGKTGKVMKNLFIHNCYIHDIPRANEILSHGFDIDRLLNVVVTNNRFERTGVNDSYGAPLSFSGRIKYGYTAKNKISEFNYLAIEHVANRFMITTNNVITSTATNGGVGVAISDNDLNLTQYLWIENNNVNVQSRPFYVYGAKNVTFDGGTYVGRLGVDGTPKNSVFKNFSLTVWPKAGQAAGSVMDYAWQFDGAASGNDVRDLTVSTAGTQTNSPGGPSVYTIKLNGSTSNNTFTNVTTILGKNANNTYAGTGAITNNGTNNTITNPTFSQNN